MDEIAQRVKERVGVVVGEKTLGRQPGGARPRQGGRDRRSRRRRRSARRCRRCRRWPATAGAPRAAASSDAPRPARIPDCGRPCPCRSRARSSRRSRRCRPAAALPAVAPARLRRCAIDAVARFADDRLVDPNDVIAARCRLRDRADHRVAAAADDGRRRARQARIVRVSAFRRRAPRCAALQTRHDGRRETPRGRRTGCRTSSASSNVLASATVGPDAITLKSSPTTSEIAKRSSQAPRVRAASQPPLIAERCLRTVLSA